MTRILDTDQTSGTVDAARTVCILGFPRSGTSLVAQLCNLLGVDLGPQADLLPHSEGDNPRGYWEPHWMNDLNDELLELLGGAWWQPLYAEAGWEDRAEVAPRLEEARRLLGQKYGSARLWGWKDPRTMLTLPFWRKLVPDASYVLCLRNPADAIASLQRRPEPMLAIEQWGRLWLEYMGRGLKEIAGRPLHVVFYEDLFERPDEELARLASFLGTGPSGNPALRTAIEQDLRHHTTTPAQLAGIPGIPVEARALFLILREQKIDAARQLAPELWWANRLRTERPTEQTAARSRWRRLFRRAVAG